MSLETTNSLLDLLCYYGDQEPSTDYHFQQTEQSEELVTTVGLDFFFFLKLLFEEIAFKNKMGSFAMCQGSSKRFVLRCVVR